MRARQVMTRPPITVPADATVYAAAEVLLGSGISAAPVVDADGKMIGIVSEADLMNRPEIGTVPAKSWLQRLLADNTVLARDHIRAHSHHVADVMTKDVVTADERTELGEIASLMQRHHVKRIPILRDGKLVGIVSRSNLLQGLLSHEPLPATGLASDESIREGVATELARYPWASCPTTNVIVDKGIVHLWGYVDSRLVRDAMRVAAENVPGVRRVVNNVTVLPPEIHFSI
jgi:CBS domain-containing protein